MRSYCSSLILDAAYMRNPPKRRLGFVFPTGNLKRRGKSFFCCNSLVSSFATKRAKACAFVLDPSINQSVSSDHERDKKTRPCSPQLLCHILSKDPCLNAVFLRNTPPASHRSSAVSRPILAKARKCLTPNAKFL